MNFSTDMSDECRHAVTRASLIEVVAVRSKRLFISQKSWMTFRNSSPCAIRTTSLGAHTKIIKLQASVLHHVFVLAFISVAPRYIFIVVNVHANYIVKRTRYFRESGERFRNNLLQFLLLWRTSWRYLFAQFRCSCLINNLSVYFALYIEYFLN